VGNKDPNDKKGNQIGEVGSESSDGPDECRIEHGCDNISPMKQYAEAINSFPTSSSLQASPVFYQESCLLKNLPHG